MFVAQTASAVAPTIRILPDVTMNVNDQQTFTVTAENFNHLSIQFNINFNSGLLDFVNFSDINPALSEMQIFNVPFGDPIFKPGIQMVWLEDSLLAKNLPPNTVLFKFTLKGKSPGITNLFIPCNADYACEAIDGLFNIDDSIPSFPAKVTITGTQTFNGLTLDIGEASGPVGSEVCVDVKVIQQFTEVVGFQFSLAFDETKLQYKSVKNFASALPGFGSGSFNNAGAPQGLVCTWNDQGDPLGYNLVDGSTFFTVCFTVLGPNGTTTPVVFNTNNPDVANEFYDSNEDVISPTTLLSGSVTAGGAGVESITITSSQDVGLQGSVVCNTISVSSGFDSLKVLKFSLQFDPTKITPTSSYLSGCNPLLNLDCSVPSSNISLSGDVISFTWNTNAASGLSLPNGSSLFKVCFSVLGGPGTIANVDLGGFAGNPVPIATDAAGDNFVMNYNDGKITVPSGNSVIVGAESQDICPGTTVCFPINFSGNTCVDAMEFAIQYDPTVLTFTELKNCYAPLNLTCSTTGSLNFAPGPPIVFTWFPQGGPGFPIPDTSLFSVCFQIPNLNNVQTTISIVPNPFTSALEVTACGAVALNVIPLAATINITTNACVQPCNLSVAQNIKKVTCLNGSDGQITLTVTGGSGNYGYKWSAGVAGGAQNIAANLQAGTYDVTVTDLSNPTCSLVVKGMVVLPGSLFTAVATVVDAGCGPGATDGSISLAISGSAGPFSYQWTPNVGSTNPLTGIGAGLYNVLITNTQSGCSVTLNGIQVKSGVDPNLFIFAETFSPKCVNGNDGAISAIATGGSGNYAWSWNTVPVQTSSNAINLTAGIYTAVVTDNTTGCTSSKQFMVDAPPDITVNGIVNNASSATSANGGVITTVLGGSGGNTYVWSSVPVQTSANLVNVLPGIYSVTVTTSNACTKVEFFNIGFDINPPNTGLVITNSNNDKYNGFGVSCNGECDGSLQITMPSAAVSPFGVTWSSNANGQTGLVANNLCAGTYGATLTDATGTKWTSMGFVVTQPNPLQLSIITQASPPTAVANVTGGVPPFAYRFNNGDLQSSNELLVDGYKQITVYVQDANNCFVNATKNGPLADRCDEARLVITPNGDGSNETFYLPCAEAFTSNKLYIFDRFGRTVFSTSDYNNNWNGIDQGGKELDEGAYFWAFEYTSNGESQIAKGSITIVR